MSKQEMTIDEAIEMEADFYRTYRLAEVLVAQGEPFKKELEAAATNWIECKRQIDAQLCPSKAPESTQVH